MPLLLFIVFIGLVIFFAGVLFIAKKLGKNASAIIGIFSLLVMLWAWHYYSDLSGKQQLGSDREWHLVYMNMILIGVPVIAVVAGIVGYRMRMKEYYRQYKVKTGDE